MFFPFRPVLSRLDLQALGIISILMFWGMLEMGVAMVAVCLPTLRPLFHDWTPESVMRSLLSVFPVSSKTKSYRSFPDDQRGGGDSDIALADTKSSVYAAHANQHQTYATGPLTTQPRRSEQMSNGEVWVNRDLTQTVEAV